MSTQEKLPTAAEILRNEFKENKTILLSEYNQSIAKFREFVYRTNQEYNSIEGFQKLSNVWNGRAADPVLNAKIEEFIVELKQKQNA